MSDARHDTNPVSARPASFRRRLFWLLVCCVSGLGIGLAGYRLSADPVWFLALPAAMAVGWLFFANPEACASGRDGRHE